MSSQESIPQTFDSNRKRLQAAQQNLNLPESVVDTASMIYKQAYREDLYHGRSIDDILSACLHLACRMEQHATSPSKIATEFETDRQSILKTSRHFESELGLKTAPVNPKGYIDQFSDTLSLSSTTQTLAHEIFDAFLESGQDSGKSPTGLAAGAIYAATKETDERLTQKKLSEVADVSEVTIRNLYKVQQNVFATQSHLNGSPTQTPVATND